MTHPEPARTEGPKRTPRFNGVVLLLVLLLFVIAGAYVWTSWSANDDRAPDDAVGRAAQAAELPTADAGSLSPEGAEATR